MFVVVESVVPVEVPVALDADVGVDADVVVDDDADADAEFDVVDVGVVVSDACASGAAPRTPPEGVDRQGRFRGQQKDPRKKHGCENGNETVNHEGT